MSLINKEVNDFEVKAFQNDEFKTVKKEDILGKWRGTLPLPVRSRPAKWSWR